MDCLKVVWMALLSVVKWVRRMAKWKEGKMAQMRDKMMGQKME
jgi:hypothetical protein